MEIYWYRIGEVMKKKILMISLVLGSFMLTGCSEELENLSNNVKDSDYVYPDSKDVVVSLENYNKLASGMTEQQVWDIIGGKCTNTGTTDIGIGEEYITVSYGCNGNGSVGSNVILMFQGGKLSTMSQIGLK